MPKEDSTWTHEPDVQCPICKEYQVYSTTMTNSQYLSYSIIYACKCGHEWEDCREIG